MRAQESCDSILERLLTEAKASQKSRASLDEIPSELKPLITKIVRSGTRTKEQHQALADAVQSYLQKNGLKSKIENSSGGGLDIIVEDVSEDSPFTWAKRVPDKLGTRFNYKLQGLFNTDVILNPYTPGLRGGSAQFRSRYDRSGALVYSAKALMSKRFHASSDGHEAIHARTASDTTPQIVFFTFKSKLNGKIGADLYGREFSSDEIHSAYPFSVRTSLRDIEPGKEPQELGKESFTELEMTILRNAIVQGLYETVEPVYEAALKPGVISKNSIVETSVWGGDRALVIKTDDNQVNVFFSSEQVNRWKLEQDPNASKSKDWSKDARTVRAMMERDYLASKRATRESDWLVKNLTGPKPSFSSYREAAQRFRQLQDFVVLGDSESSRSKREEAALRVIEQGQGETKLDLNQKKQLAKQLLEMQQVAKQKNITISEGTLSVQNKGGSWITVDANNPNQSAPATQIFEALMK